MIKVSDFTDNAVGLHYTTGAKASPARARKYAPLVPILQDLAALPDTPLATDVKDHIRVQLNRAADRCAAPRARGGETLAISISLVLVLGIAVWALHKYNGMKVWHGLLCVLFGFYLASSSLAPEINTTMTAIIHALTGQG